MEGTGKVWIAGAGPGDAELMTVKVRKLLSDADVIVYDALVSAEIFSLIPAETEKIFVGKRLGNHAMSQEEIGKILVLQAQKGKQVLRLKGGDPFVFGRGGEEAAYLAAHGILYEIVPGVTSAVAAAAYAGIPVTHRDYVSSFHVITGHPQKDGGTRIDYRALVRMGGTLIFLMGLTSLKAITEGLITAGMRADMPAAVVESGTTAKQKKVLSDLAHLEEKVRQEAVGMPAVIVVGEVCRLSEELEWVTDRPLFGRQIVVTRPRENRGCLADDLRRLGAQVIELPTIRIRPIRENPRLWEELGWMQSRMKMQNTAQEASALSGADEGRSPGSVQWLIFTSPIGVQVFFEQLQSRRRDIRTVLGEAKALRIAAIGPATAKRLEQYGIFDVEVPHIFCSKELGEYIADRTGQTGGGHAVILRAREGSKELLPPLEKAGLTVTDIPLYETIYAGPSALSAQVEELLEKREIHAVTFTSGSTVRGFAGLMGGAMKEVADRFLAVCIGEQTAAVAREYHMRTVTSDEASVSAVEETILRYL